MSGWAAIKPRTPCPRHVCYGGALALPGRGLRPRGARHALRPCSRLGGALTQVHGRDANCVEHGVAAASSRCCGRPSTPVQVTTRRSSRRPVFAVAGEGATPFHEVSVLGIKGRRARASGFTSRIQKVPSLPLERALTPRSAGGPRPAIRITTTFTALGGFSLWLLLNRGGPPLCRPGHRRRLCRPSAARGGGRACLGRPRRQEVRTLSGSDDKAAEPSKGFRRQRRLYRREHQS